MIRNKTNAPQNGHFFSMFWPWYFTLTLADDLDLGTSRYILMRCTFIPNMSLVIWIDVTVECYVFRLSFGQTDRQTHGQPDNSKTFSPDLLKRGENKNKIGKFRQNDTAANRYTNRALTARPNFWFRQQQPSKKFTCCVLCIRLVFSCLFISLCYHWRYNCANTSHHICALYTAKLKFSCITSLSLNKILY